MQKAYFGMQGAGLHFSGVAPTVAADIFNIGVRTVLTYSCHALYLFLRSLRKIEVAQGKLIKSLFGLQKYSHTTPLLVALNISPACETITISALNMLRSCQCPCISYPTSVSEFDLCTTLM